VSVGALEMTSSLFVLLYCYTISSCSAKYITNRPWSSITPLLPHLHKSVLPHKTQVTFPVNIKLKVCCPSCFDNDVLTNFSFAIMAQR